MITDKMPPSPSAFALAALGLGLFIIFDLMFFGCLGSSQILLKTGNPAWREIASFLPLSTAGSFAIILCAFALLSHLQVLAIKHRSGERAIFSLVLLTTSTYIGKVIYSFIVLSNQGLLPSTTLSVAVYEVWISLHALHILGAAGVLVGLNRKSVNQEIRQKRVELWRWYCGFIVITGLVMLGLFYVV